MRSRVLCACAGVAGLLALAGSVCAQGFNYSNFNSTAGLQLNGVAVQSNGLAGEQKTLSITELTARSAGSFYYGARPQLDQGFTTQFRFRMRDRAGLGADGLAFIIQNQGLTALGGEGGGMGFATHLTVPTDPSGRPNTGIANSVAIAFDTWDNSGQWATVPGGNILAVQTRGVLANAPDATSCIGALSLPGAFNDTAIHTAKITYTPGLMSIYYDNLIVPALAVPLNLSSTLSLASGGAFVGFTAATSDPAHVQRHEILDWSLSTVALPSPGPVSIALIAGWNFARRRHRSKP